MNFVGEQSPSLLEHGTLQELQGHFFENIKLHWSEHVKYVTPIRKIFKCLEDIILS